MSFEPKSGANAIIEVVFGLGLSRRLSGAEIDLVIAAHEQFREDLPRIGRTNVFTMMAEGSEPPPFQIPVPVGGVSFDAVKKDGTLDWRLRIEDGSIFVNCLSYTRWQEVLPRARQYVQIVSNALQSSGKNLKVSSFALQYIDVFDWKGPKEKYDIDLLLRADSPCIPGSIRKKGVFWHLHQGWFRDAHPIGEGRVLERVNVDAVLEQVTEIPAVKIDTYHRLELTAGVGLGDLAADGAIFDKFFDWLHAQEKDIFRSYLTDEIQQRIGLNDK